MPVLSAANIAKSYGVDKVLDSASFQMERGERVGLVGANGAGKTTLLRILCGLEQPDSGAFTMARGTTLGYLEQSSHAAAAGTMEQELRRAFSDTEQIERSLKALEQQMADPATTADPELLDSLMDRYGKLRHRYEAADGYHTEARLRSVSAGLGFKPEDWQRPAASFSGGEQTRLQLARLILEEPDLLLLDEPTNHLDINAVEWLEGTLREYSGSVLLISHDRYFLDRTVSRVLAIESYRLKSYPGNYTAYKAQHELELVTQQNAYKKQQQVIEKEMELIRTSGTGEREKRQAKSREKRLARVELVDKPGTKRSMIPVFGYTGRSGEIVARLEGVTKAYDGKPVFSGINVEVRWGDRVAMVGPNGAGKTTLLKIISGELAPDSGKVYLGPGVHMTYFDQHRNAIAPDKTPLLEIMDSSLMNLTEARTYLGRFLFSGDDVFKKNSDLSGGEWSRLALAKLGLDGGNFLVLDEPTNHLDIRSTEELEKAIASFPGTLLVVSHDRYFLSRISTRTIEVEGGKATLFKMPYSEYLAVREMSRNGNQENVLREERRQKAEQEKLAREREQAGRRERRRREQQVSRLEDDIAGKEQFIAALEAELADPGIFEDFRLAKEKGEQLKRTQDELEVLLRAWEELCQEMDKN